MQNNRIIISLYELKYYAKFDDDKINFKFLNGLLWYLIFAPIVTEGVYDSPLSIYTYTQELGNNVVKIYELFFYRCRGGISYMYTLGKMKQVMNNICGFRDESMRIMLFLA